MAAAFLLDARGAVSAKFMVPFQGSKKPPGLGSAGLFWEILADEESGLLGKSTHLDGEAALEAAGGVFVQHLGLGSFVCSGREFIQACGCGTGITLLDSCEDFLAQRADAAFHSLIARSAGLRAADVFFGRADVGHKRGLRKGRSV